MQLFTTATDKYNSIFVSDEVADIKSVMQSYGEAKEQQQAIETWLCDYADGSVSLSVSEASSFKPVDLR